MAPSQLIFIRHNICFDLCFIVKYCCWFVVVVVVVYCCCKDFLDFNGIHAHMRRDNNILQTIIVVKHDNIVFAQQLANDIDNEEEEEETNNNDDDNDNDDAILQSMSTAHASIVADRSSAAQAKRHQSSTRLRPTRRAHTLTTGAAPDTHAPSDERCKPSAATNCRRPPRYAVAAPIRQGADRRPSSRTQQRAPPRPATTPLACDANARLPAQCAPAPMRAFHDTKRGIRRQLFRWPVLCRCIDPLSLSSFEFD